MLRDELNFPILLEQILTGRITFGKVGELKGIKIFIYPKENGHNEPHCHIVYQENQISISLESFSILAGNLPPKQSHMAIEWVKKNIGVLQKYWNYYHEEIVA